MRRRNLPIVRRVLAGVDMFRIGKTFKFDAAHQLTGLEINHPCMRLHGHTYNVTLTLRAQYCDEHGWVHDYGKFKPFKLYLDTKLDHRYLNEELGFQPTAELLAQHLFYQAEMLLPLPDGTFVDSVIVKETESTFAEYSRQ